MRTLLLAFGLTAVALYVCALPLWEGWDEPFHYGYVENLAVLHKVPVLGRAKLTKEIAQSLRSTPLPGFLARDVARSTPFAEWRRMTLQTQRSMRASLNSISPKLRGAAGDGNYEAQQAPLAYTLLVPFEWLVSRVQLVHRVVVLRAIESVVSMLFLFWGLQRMASIVQLREPFRSAAVFCAVATQTLWASICHVGNDAVAIPLALWFCVLLVEGKRGIAASLVFSAGLLTKAYFLAFAPVFFIWLAMRKPARWRLAAVAPFVLAGPWYARNAILYGSISGTQETVTQHVSFVQALSAAPHIDWVRSLLTFVRASLWSGNWSSITFTRGALYAEAAMLVCGLAMCAFLRKKNAVWMWAVTATLAAGLLYQTCVTWVASHAGTPEPWYAQGVLAALWIFAFAGLAGLRGLGRIVAVALTLLAGAIALCCWPLVLLPEYVSDVHFGGALRWWSTAPWDELRLLFPAPLPLTLALLAGFTVVTILVVAAVTWRLCRVDSGYGHPVGRFTARSSEVR